MEFKNRPNKSYNVDGKLVWESRSVAVAGVVFAWKVNEDYPYVLISERGPKSADFQGKQNLVCGYLDWDETGTEAMIRETWEEVGLNLIDILDTKEDMINNMEQPWYVHTNVNANRQNITLRYGLCYSLNDNENLPELTTIHNEVVGEVSNPQWISFNEIDKYEWAFGHDQVIKDYLEYIIERS